MVLYLCHLTLHDNVFFASREMGTLYETEKYLHNWALSYALFEGTGDGLDLWIGFKHASQTRSD